MKWVIIGIIVILAYLFMIVACKRASDWDDIREEMYREKKEEE
jgi:hypothetical protein